MSPDNTMNMQVTNPFGESADKPSGQLTAGARGMQTRENTEIMAMVAMAKRFPRNQIACADKIRNAFTRPALAEKAQYQFAKGGTDIAGPSIRAAEAISQQWGNMSNGWREVSRWKDADGVGVSEVQAYSVDFETNNREELTFVVRHWRDTKRGGYALTDERDIYELCANQAQRRKRACILAMVPGDVVEMAMEQAAATLSAKADVSPEGQARLLAAFAEFNVPKEAIEKKIQRRMDSIRPAQVVMLKRIYASLRDDMSVPADWFEIEAAPPPAAGLDAVRKAVTTPPPPPADKPSADKPAKGAEPDADGVLPEGKPAAAPARTARAAAAPKAPAAPPPPPPAPPPGVGASVAQYRKRIEDASDSETAALELDEARSALSGDEYDALCILYRQHWGR